MAQKTATLVADQDGFLGMDSARGEDGVGITVCYRESLEAIEAWGETPNTVWPRGSASNGGTTTSPCG